MTPAAASLLRFHIYPTLLLLTLIDGCLEVGSLVFFVDRTGSIAAANRLSGIFWIAMTIAEMPTGYFSDLLGPKRAILTGVFLRAVGFIIYYQSVGSVSLLMVATAMTGVAVTFLSGMLQVQLKVMASRMDLQLDASRVTAEMMGTHSLGRLGGAIIFYLAARYASLDAIWLACIGISAVTILHLSWVWPNVVMGGSANPFRQVVNAARELKARPALLGALVLNGVLLMLSLSVATNWIAVVVPDLTTSFGPVVASAIFAAGVRMVYSTVRSRFEGSAVGLSAVLVAYGAAHLVAAVPHRGVAFLGGLLSFVLVSEAQLLVRKQILVLLPEREGGTVSSIQSLMENAAGALGLIGLGWALERISIQGSWVVCGALLIATGGLVRAFRLRFGWQ